ncbi:MAG: NUMOD3 domain-containing DNA-binding protein [Candidatus Nanoarchaeia archaeon]|jgi:hypothetical protein|nr:NUMOD3 domain-containing DNA-binding protein [Candidatus Nanoarchaeia archaeon]
MESQKIHYVYLTTNLINGKQYIGDHTININDKKYYIGSGGAIYGAINKYGSNMFFKEILEWFSTRKEAFDAQEKYIRLYKTHISQGGYNKSPKGGLCVNGCHSEETKRKIGNSNKGKKCSEETKRKISKKSKLMWGKEEYQNKIKKSLIGKNLGKHPSIEAREKMRNGSINKNLGKKHSEETKQKMKNAWINRKRKNIN